MTVRARFDGKVFIPIDPVEIPKDQVVELDVRESEPPRGSPAAVLSAIQSLPTLEPGDADALDAAIESGKLPARDDGIFDDSKE